MGTQTRLVNGLTQQAGARLYSGGALRRSYRRRKESEIKTKMRRRCQDDLEELNGGADPWMDPLAGSLGELQPFYEQGLVCGEPSLVRSGKEATVYRCRAAPGSGEVFLAAKVYRPLERRSFRNDTVYREGRVIVNSRDRRAVEKKSDWGQDVRFGCWVNEEFEVLSLLHQEGADVPRPMARAGRALLMQWIGQGTEPAPHLRSVTLGPEEALRLFRRVLCNIEIALRCDRVHGDLSAYNILYQAGRVTLIDFPQAVDARSNRNAAALLLRDIENVCGHFGRLGVRSDPRRLARDLWAGYRYAGM